MLTDSAKRMDISYLEKLGNLFEVNGSPLNPVGFVLPGKTLLLNQEESWSGVAKQMYGLNEYDGGEGEG